MTMDQQMFILLQNRSMRFNINYNVHEAINYRSHKKGCLSDLTLNFIFKLYIRTVSVDRIKMDEIYSAPAGRYNSFYPILCGKLHSSYGTRGLKIKHQYLKISA